MCVLRVHGDELVPERFLETSSLAPYSVFNRGDRRFKVGNAVYETSGFKVDVSFADWKDRQGQFADAIEFLRRNATELRRLMSWPGVEEVILDFPFEATGFATFIRCPLELAREASGIGIQLEFSIYPETP